jgi:hypothetical protein
MIGVACSEGLGAALGSFFGTYQIEFRNTEWYTLVFYRISSKVQYGLPSIHGVTAK